MQPFDPNCGRFALEISSVAHGAEGEWDGEEEWADVPEVERERLTEAYARTDGTYNPANGHFLCDECYIKLGQPSSPRGWVCP